MAETNELTESSLDKLQGELVITATALAARLRADDLRGEPGISQLTSTSGVLSATIEGIVKVASTKVYLQESELRQKEFTNIQPEDLPF